MTEKSNAQVVKTAGRGVIYITAAKMWFMLSGWILIFILPRLFKWSAGGDEQEGMVRYGMYSLVITGISFINNGVITGTIQSVSKFTAQQDNRAGAIRKTATRFMAAAGIVLAGGYALLAETVAHHWFHSTDPQLIFLMRLSALIIVAYSIYAVFIGTLNGQRRFMAQAGFDITYTTVKIAVIIAMIALGYGVLGAIGGFLFAAVGIATAAGLFTRIPTGEHQFPTRKFASFAAVLVLYTFLLNLVLMADLFVLGGIISRLATAHGQSPAEAFTLLNTRAAQYKAVQQLSFIPYQAVIAIAFVVFPLISKVTASNDKAAIRTYIHKTMRFSLILLAGLASVFAGASQGAMGLVFPAEYQPAHVALRILPFGIVAFGLMVVANTILNAAGKKWHALTVVCVGIVLVALCNWLLVNSGGKTDPSALALAATGTSLGMVGALLLAALFLKQNLGAFLPRTTALRVVIACLLSTLIGTQLPATGPITTLVSCAAILVIYFVLLAVTREFTKEDFTQLGQILGKRRKSA